MPDLQESNKEVFLDIVHSEWSEWQNSRGDLARLRRARSIEQIAIQESYIKLHYKLISANLPGWIAGKLNKQLPLIAGVIAHVKKEKPEIPFARAIGFKVQGRPIVSEVRFRRLLRITDNYDLYTTLIRLIKMNNGEANVKDVAEATLLWNERTENTKKRWASEYYCQTDIFNPKKNGVIE